MIEENKKNIFEQISFYTISVLAFLLPFIFLPGSIVPLGYVKTSLIIIAVIISSICLLINSIKTGVFKISKKIEFIPIILLPVIYLVSTISSVNRFLSIRAVGGNVLLDNLETIVSLSLLFFVTYTLIKDNRDRIYKLLAFIFLGVLVSFILQLFRVFGGEMFSFGLLFSPAETLMGRWNDLGIISLVVIGIAVVALEKTKLHFLVNIILILSIICSFFILSMSSLNFDLGFVSVSVHIVLAIISLFIFACLLSLNRKDDPKKNKIPAFSLAVLILSIVVLIFSGSLNSYLTDKFNVQYAEGRPSWGATYNIFANVIKERPIFGSGPGTFSYEWQINKPIDVNESLFWNTDFNYGIGIIPSTAVTVGLLGFSFWVLFYVLILVLGIKLIFIRRNENILVVLASVFGFSITTISLLFYNPDMTIYALNIFFAVFIVALSPKKELQINFTKNQILHFITVLVIVVVVIAEAFWLVSVLKRNTGAFFANKSLEARESNIEQSVLLAEKSVYFDSLNPIFRSILSDSTAFYVVNLSNKGKAEMEGNSEKIKSMVSKSVESAFAAELLSKTDYRFALKTGQLLEAYGGLGIPGAFDRAFEKYIYSTYLNPKNPTGYILASRVALFAGDRQKSREALKRAIELKSDYGSIPALAQVILDLATKLDNNVAEVSKDTEDKEKDN